jgi:Tol biopolymer transport system component
MGKSGTPRWSPDSRWIAFDSDGRFGQAGIYIVSAEGGPVRPLVDDAWNNSVPSWSRDGKWIYFASNRSSSMEENQVWKIPVEGGQPLQVTRFGGFSAYQSLDGQTLYYAKTRQDSPEIWQVPVNGGNESRVSAILRPGTWANWALTENGILFLSADKEKAPTLEYFEFATRGVRPLGMLEKASFWLSASQDGNLVWYSELTPEQAHLVFRTDEN